MEDGDATVVMAFARKHRIIFLGCSTSIIHGFNSQSECYLIYHVRRNNEFVFAQRLTAAIRKQRDIHSEDEGTIAILYEADCLFSGDNQSLNKSRESIWLSEAGGEYLQ